MKLSIAFGDLSKQPSELLLLPLFAGARAPKEKKVGESVSGWKNGATGELEALDRLAGGLLLSSAKEERFAAKSDQLLLLHTHQKAGAKRVGLLGLGHTPEKPFPLSHKKKEDAVAEALRLAMGRAARAARKTGARTMAIGLAHLGEHCADEKLLTAAAEGLLLGAYRFEQYRSKEQDSGKTGPELTEVRILLPQSAAKNQAALKNALRLAESTGRWTNWARDLVNIPANDMTPRELAKRAREVAKECALEIEVLGPAQIERLRMGLFRGVAQGSPEPAQLIHLTYRPKGARAAKGATTAPRPLALVGKAITFDSGGLSLKPSDAMLDMKTDMAGAAAVMGAMAVISQIAPPFPVHAYMGACENMVGGKAYKLGDVLRSRLGKTVEITNTDAEGRLVLGDMLAYANEQKPFAIIDLATLTGACMVALGYDIAGLFSPDDVLANELERAGDRAGEELWRLPITEHVRESLSSEIADMKNAGDRMGGASSAALFLKEFVGETSWAHLDIAGPSRARKDRGHIIRGGSGFGLRTLVEFVRTLKRETGA